MTRQVISFGVVLTAILGCLLSAPPKAQVTTAAGSQAARAPIPPPICVDGASPGVIQLVPEGTNKLRLARKRFYLSSYPFNLTTTVTLTTAPTLRSFYQSAGAKPQLIAWLEENHCESIYCRPLTIDDVTCEGRDPKKCVSEFTTAYANALVVSKGNQDLALKLIANYPPLSSSNLGIGFYHARTEWLKDAIAKIEASLGKDARIRSTITDRDGIGYFYDLCPGNYYVSSVGPIDIDGVDVVWETVKPIKVEGPPEVKTATRVTLAFPPGKDRKNVFVGKPLAEVINPKPPAP